MKYALFNGKKTHAKNVNSGDRGFDLWFQNYPVIACVGKYRQYWRYDGDKPELPNGYEPETEWHAAWKQAVNDDNCEVICGENREHRADIKTDTHIIEIQRSSIDGWAVVERNLFYKNLTGSRVIWVVNVEKSWKNISTELINKKQFRITWKYAWKWVKEISQTTDTELYLDFNSQNDKLIKMWTYPPKESGTLHGTWVSKIDFFNKYLLPVAKQEYVTDKKSFLDIFKTLNSAIRML